MAWDGMLGVSRERVLLHFNTNQFNNVEINADNNKNVYRRHYNLPAPTNPPKTVPLPALPPHPSSSSSSLSVSPHQLRYN